MSDELFERIRFEAIASDDWSLNPGAAYIQVLVRFTPEEVAHALAAAGYHVVREGQAVVDGQLVAVEPDFGVPGYGSLELLTDLPEPPPVVDETTTTTTEPEA